MSLATRPVKKKARKRRKVPHERPPDECDSSGMLKDLAHLDAALPERPVFTSSADVEQFFDNRRDRDKEGEQKSQKVHDCIICKKQKAAKYTIVTDVSTSRRHLAALHKVPYLGSSYTLILSFYLTLAYRGHIANGAITSGLDRC